MNEKFVSFLCDPASRQDFVKLEVYSKDKKGEIISGLIYSKTDWYPIIKGIPRLLTGELKTNLLQEHHAFFQKYKKKLSKKVSHEWLAAIAKIQNLDKFLEHQKKTGESFAFEWTNIYKENNYEKDNYLHFVAPFIKEEDIKGKKIIDIGCGSGRFSKWPAIIGAEMVVGVDLGESVETAYKLTKHLDNVCIVQGDIYNIPAKSVFDIAYSIGVLHHLPKPKEGFLSLPKVVKKGGLMEIWVYSRRNNNRALYFYEPVRWMCRSMPKKILFRLCYIPASIVHLFNYITLGLKKLGQESLSEKIPFFYYANFPFNMKLNDSFDVLATPKSNYYFSEEVESWFNEAKLKNIKSYEHAESGITVIGRKSD